MFHNLFASTESHPSTMSKFFLLVCALYLVQSLGAEKYAKEMFDDCNSHRECKNLKYTLCYGGKCWCIPTYVGEYEGCKGKVNATCDSDDDCQDRKEVGCIFNTCQSYATFFTSSNADQVKLYRAEKIGSPCGTDENCSDLDSTECKSGRCECKKGYWKDDDLCRLVTNTSCAKDSDCKENGTKCLLNDCISPTDFFVESNAHNTTVYAAKQLGDVCQTDHHCRNINNSQCNNGVCDCGRGTVKFIHSGDGSSFTEECRQILNVYCESDTTCYYYRNAKCFFNNCSTAEDFFIPSNAHNVSLYAATHAGDVCRTDHHCRYVENSSCVNDECHCNENFTQIYRECHKLSDLHCTHDSDCKKYNVWCFSNACQHESYYFESADINKYRAKWFEGYCRIDVNCNELNNTICESRKCVCERGYKYESGECREVPPADCSENHSCSEWGKKCFFGRCLTPSKFFDSASPEIFNEYAVKDYNDVCRTDHHCRNLKNRTCLFKRCYCIYGWNEVSGVCQQTLNVTCSDDSDCLRRWTYCFDNTCLYPVDYFNRSNANTNLYATKRIYGYCASDHHCRNQANTYCFHNKCNCLSGYEYVHGSCQKAINVTCSDDSECLLPRSYCFLNTCLYPEDFLLPSNGYNISLYAAKRIDGFCQTNHHCREIQGSKCFHRRCVCKNPNSSNGNRCDE